jgi:hypothetical protein
MTLKRLTSGLLWTLLVGIEVAWVVALIAVLAWLALR